MDSSLPAVIMDDDTAPADCPILSSFDLEMSIDEYSTLTLAHPAHAVSLPSPAPAKVIAKRKVQAV
jgi:hypothetical protein